MCSDFFLNDKTSKWLDKKIQNITNRIGLDRKTLDEVFDISTLHSIEKLISNRILDIIDFPISTGKEGNVFRGITPDKKNVAIKIYRTSNLTFKHISKYIVGDPRFKDLHKNRRDLIYEWTKKEYKNLQRAYKAGVDVPKPIVYINNVLVMEYIGVSDVPAPLMKDIKLKNPRKIFDTLIGFISKMYQKAEIVHGDISAFNVLIFKNKPYLIDFGQGVLIEHPNALEFLKRDIHNIVSYFKKFNILADENEILESITKKS